MLTIAYCIEIGKEALLPSAGKKESYKAKTLPTPVDRIFAL